METRQLSGTLYSDLIRGGAANLKANAKIVDELNVFPIPDGDTGSNMTLTISGGVSAAIRAEEVNLSGMSDSIATGMLLSARGNSGVILSQFFSGVAKGFTGSETADVRTVGFAFKSGVRRAYESVMKPTEGTMLTVMREATDYACERITDESTLEQFFADVVEEMNKSLQRTPELLAVLKEAGVIDSGGQGLVYIMDGMNRTLNGENISETAGTSETVAHAVDVSVFTEDSVMEFGYCTEFLMRLQNSKVDVKNFDINVIIDYLQTIGDSIVAVKNDSIVKVHVHTLTPGNVFNFCQQFGEFLTLKCENMTIQHNETLAEDKSEKTEPAKAVAKKYATIAVASGEGIQEAFRELGVDYVMDGGQGKNPSSEDFLEAFEAVNAENIFVLPNNGNIVMAAQLAGSLYEKAKVAVIPSKSIGDGYAAMSMCSYDSDDFAEIENTLNEAMAGVITGQVTKSVRDANIDGVAIKENDFIGFAGKTMLASNEDKIVATAEMLRKMEASDHEVAIVIYGRTATVEDKENLRKLFKESYRRTEVYEIDGGQEVYDFEIVLE